jgi:hypothetical protein
MGTAVGFGVAEGPIFGVGVTVQVGVAEDGTVGAGVTDGLEVAEGTILGVGVTVRLGVADGRWVGSANWAGVVLASVVVETVVAAAGEGVSITRDVLHAANRIAENSRRMTFQRVILYYHHFRNCLGY